MPLKIAGVIPARLGSTRLHEKILRPIAGKSMIQRVWERAIQARSLSDLLVACDDERILNCVKDFGGKALMTAKEHSNGTSRIAEIARGLDADVFINIQGDEPTIHPEVIDALARVFQEDGGVRVATLAVRKHDREEYENPNVVKVVCNHLGDALYFSRSPVPYERENPGGAVSYLKHLGIYGYRKDFLLQFVAWPPGKLETIEKLEQLRILERGVPVRVIETANDSISVDTADDLAAVERELEK